MSEETCARYKPEGWHRHLCRCAQDPRHVEAGQPHRCECGVTWPVQR